MVSRGEGAREGRTNDDAEGSEHVAPAEVLGRDVAGFGRSGVFGAAEARDDDEAEEGGEDGAEREAKVRVGPMRISFREGKNVPRMFSRWEGGFREKSTYKADSAVKR